MEFNDEEKDLSISQARSTLSQLCNDLAEHPHKGAIRITNNGEPKAVLIGPSLFEALIETLEIVSDQSLMKSLRKSIKEAQQGNLIPLSTVEDELGL